jgi:hypothetical protein
VIYWAASSPICNGLDFYGPDPAQFSPFKKKKIFCNDLCFIGLCPAQYVMVWIFMGQTRPSLAHFKKQKENFL